MHEGKVYVIRSGDSHYYKMGLTKDTIHQRIKQLQTGNPYQLRPICSHVVSHMRIAETILHQRYFQQRGRLEWFYFNTASSMAAYPLDIADVLAYIDIKLDGEIDYRLSLKELQT